MQGVNIQLDKKRTLRFDFNALSDIEEQAGYRGILYLISERSIGFNTLRLMVWGGLRWQDEELTIKQAGEILQKYMEDEGDMQRLGDNIREALIESGLLGKKKSKEVTEKAETEK